MAVAEGLGVDVSEVVTEDIRWFWFGKLRGVVFVGPVLMNWVIRVGVLAGVTLSMNWKAGRRRTVVLWSEWSGIGMLEAESMRRPLLGFTLPLSTASIMLPFSSATSLTQSLFPVATIKCVLHPFICPYSSSV